MDEIWKPFDEWYDVSSLGRVRSWVAPGKGTRKRRSEPVTLKPWKDTRGYLQFSPEKGKPIGVHRAVALTFLGDPPKPYLQAAHKNGNMQDNTLDNIYWASPQQNSNDRVRHGNSGKGSSNTRAKLTDYEVRGIREEYQLGYGTYAELAGRYSVKVATVGLVIQRKTWTHV